MKGNGKRIFLVAFIVAAFALVVYCVFMTGKRQATRLPNGPELSFVAITHGPTNVWFPGGILDKLIYRQPPAKGISIGGFKVVTVTPIVDVAHYSDAVADGPLTMAAAQFKRKE